MNPELSTQQLLIKFVFLQTQLPYYWIQVRDDKQAPLRFSPDHVMFQRLDEILVSSIMSPIQGMWVPMAEQAINVVYNLAEHPDKICGQLIKKLIRKIFGSEESLDRSDVADVEKGMRDLSL